MSQIERSQETVTVKYASSSDDELEIIGGPSKRDDAWNMPQKVWKSPNTQWVDIKGQRTAATTSSRSHCSLLSHRVTPTLGPVQNSTFGFSEALHSEPPPVPTDVRAADKESGLADVNDWWNSTG